MTNQQGRASILKTEQNREGKKKRDIQIKRRRKRGKSIVEVEKDDERNERKGEKSE